VLRYLWSDARLFLQTWFAHQWHSWCLRDHARKAADLKACISARGTMSDMPSRYDRFQLPFLDTIELELKAKHTSAASRVIHAIGRRVRHYYIEGHFTSRAEAERTFRALVEQDETCKSCKIFTVYR
jgi:hypothetical protein